MDLVPRDQRSGPLEQTQAHRQLSLMNGEEVADDDDGNIIALKDKLRTTATIDYGVDCMSNESPSV